MAPCSPRSRPPRRAATWCTWQRPSLRGTHSAHQAAPPARPDAPAVPRVDPPPLPPSPHPVPLGTRSTDFSTLTEPFLRQSKFFSPALSAIPSKAAVLI